jgi:hypothetical protein
VSSDRCESWSAWQELDVQTSSIRRMVISFSISGKSFPELFFLKIHFIPIPGIGHPSGEQFLSGKKKFHVL